MAAPVASKNAIVPLPCGSGSHGGVVAAAAGDATPTVVAISPATTAPTTDILLSFT
jgi:hypothetical protein